MATAVNGSTTSQNNFQLDGVSVNNFLSFGAGSEGGFYGAQGIPNPDSIAEFKIQTSTYDAGYGRNPGANVNVVTKAGGNDFHGTAFEFFRNTVLNANTFFLNVRPVGAERGARPKSVWGSVWRAGQEGQALLLRVLSGNLAEERDCLDRSLHRPFASDPHRKPRYLHPPDLDSRGDRM